MDRSIETFSRRGASDSGRKAVLAAAATAFMQHGFAGTSVDDVADELGATKGRIYHYYRSKMDIYLDLHLHAIEIIFRRVQGTASQLANPRERLWAIANEHAKVLMEELPLQRVALQSIHFLLSGDGTVKKKDLAEQILAKRREYEQIFIRVIDEGIQSGDFRKTDSRLTAKAVLGCLNWLIMWFHPPAGEVQGDEEDMNRIAAELATFVVRGMLPD